MSSVMEQSHADSASPSRQADTLRSNYSGRSPAARSPHSEESKVEQVFFESSQLTDDAGLLSALEFDSHERDAETKSFLAQKGVHHRVMNEPRCRNGREEKEFFGSASTIEHQGLHNEEKEACHVTSHSGHTTALTRSPPTERASSTDGDALAFNKAPFAGGTPQEGSDDMLFLAKRCGARTPDVEHSMRRVHHMQNCEDAGRNEAALTADSRRVRRGRAEPNTSRGHHEMTQRMRGEQFKQMTSRAEKARNPLGPDPGVATAGRSISEKENTGLGRFSQQRGATTNVRRQLVHKSGKNFPTHHSTSSRSLPVSRRSSFVHCANADKKKVYSCASTMDTEVASTRSDDTHGAETQCRQTVPKRNFIRENAQNACAQQPQRQTKVLTGKPEPPRRHSSFGKIPDYLSQIKSQLKEEARKVLDKEATDKLPPGMRVMGNEERFETVRRLKKEQTEAEQELSRMPIAIKTDGQRRRLEYLERRLGELDREQQKYSKPNVLVGV